MPCLVVATKIDDYEVEQDYEQQPSDFCMAHQLPQPVPFRNRDFGNAKAKVFSQLATMATFPLVFFGIILKFLFKISKCEDSCKKLEEM